MCECMKHHTTVSHDKCYRVGEHVCHEQMCECDCHYM